MNNGRFTWFKFKTRRKTARSLLTFILLTMIFGLYLQYLLNQSSSVYETTTSENLSLSEHRPPSLSDFKNPRFTGDNKIITEGFYVDTTRQKSKKTIPFLREATPLPIMVRSVPKVRADSYVTWGGWFGDGRGLGNQMFNLAVVVSLAEMSGRQPIIQHVSSGKAIDQVGAYHCSRPTRIHRI